MLVTFGVISVNTVGVDGYVNLIGCGIFLIKGKRTVEIFKCAVQPAVTQMLNTEINKGMLSFLVNFVICRHGRPGGE